MKAKYQSFKSSMKSWETMLDEASEFASKIGEQRLINITQSCDGGQALVVVWYWSK